MPGRAVLRVSSGAESPRPQDREVQRQDAPLSFPVPTPLCQRISDDQFQEKKVTTIQGGAIPLLRVHPAGLEPATFDSVGQMFRYFPRLYKAAVTNL